MPKPLTASLQYLGESFGYRASIISGGPAYTVTKKRPSVALQVLATMAGPYQVVSYQCHDEEHATAIKPVAIDVDCTERQSTMIIAAAAVKHVIYWDGAAVPITTTMPPVNLKTGSVHPWIDPSRGGPTDLHSREPDGPIKLVQYGKTYVINLLDPDLDPIDPEMTEAARRRIENMCTEVLTHE